MRADTPRVVLVVPEPRGALGGHLVYDRRLAHELAARGLDVRLHEAAGAFPAPTPEEVRALAAFLDSLAAGTTVILDNLVGGAVPELLAAAAARLRLVLLVHHPLALEYGLLPEEGQRRRVRERAALAQVAAVLVPSRTVRDVLVRDYAVPPFRLTVAEPGIEPGPVAPGSAAGERLRLLSLAAVTARKDHLTLIRALAQLVQLPWELDLVGSLECDPLTVRRLREPIAAFGLDSRVHLHGERRGEALEALFARADLFVSSSRYEGFGLAAMEAIARGLPVVACAGGALAEVLPPTAALLVPPGHAAALAEALAAVLRDPALRARLRRGALAARAHLPRWEETAELVIRRLFTPAPLAARG